MKHPSRLRHETTAATAIEYGLIVSLIAVVILISMQELGGNVSNMYSGVGSSVSASSQE